MAGPDSADEKGDLVDHGNGRFFDGFSPATGGCGCCDGFSHPVVARRSCRRRRRKWVLHFFPDAVVGSLYSGERIKRRHADPDDGVADMLYPGRI
ncbi:hypothetical protein ACLOJK_020017 [Asimina triloba]